MHEEKSRLVVEHMVMQSRDLDAVVAQRPQHRVDLIGRQHKVARDGRLTATRWLKLIASAVPMAAGTVMPPALTSSALGIPTW